MNNLINIFINILTDIFINILTYIFINILTYFCEYFENSHMCDVSHDANSIHVLERKD
jgi:hypothetical protein